VSNQNEVPMTTNPITEESSGEAGKRVLGTCPWCSHFVFTTADAVRYDARWHHVRCALDRQSAARNVWRPHLGAQLGASPVPEGPQR
jgi:hypothetical protein